MKSANHIKIEKVETLQLPQSKSYFKTIGILYLLENTNTSIIADIVETIIKNNHIFNNITIVLRLKVIKISSKLDMAIIWLDIWDIQSGSKAKGLINRYFNVKSYIVTIREVNMNLRIPQCKNCWKQGHTTFVCRIQGSKCIKCNGPYKTEHHYYFAWCCKANFKTNPSKLETKQNKPCSYLFKCLNCKGDYQADSN